MSDSRRIILDRRPKSVGAFAPEDPQRGKKKRPPPGKSVPIIDVFGVRMFIDTGNGPSFWVDSEPVSDHAPVGGKGVEISYFLLKRAGVVLFEYDRFPNMSGAGGIFASLSNDAVAIAGARKQGGSKRFNALDGKNFNELRIYKLNAETQAVVAGWTLSTVLFNAYGDDPVPGRAEAEQEVLSWTYSPVGLEPYTDDALLQVDGRRIAHDEGEG